MIIFSENWVYSITRGKISLEICVLVNLVSQMSYNVFIMASPTMVWREKHKKQTSIPNYSRVYSS